MPRTRKAGKRYWKCIKSYWKQVLFLFKKKKIIYLTNSDGPLYMYPWLSLRQSQSTKLLTRSPSGTPSCFEFMFSL